MTEKLRMKVPYGNIIVYIDNETKTAGISFQSDINDSEDKDIVYLSLSKKNPNDTHVPYAKLPTNPNDPMKNCNSISITTHNHPDSDDATDVIEMSLKDLNEFFVKKDSDHV